MMFIEHYHLCLIIIITTHSNVVHCDFQQTTLVSDHLSKDLKSEQCLKKTIELTFTNYSYGVFDIFYDFSQNICQNMQARLDDTYLKIFVNVMTAKMIEDVLQPAFRLWLKQFWAHLSLTIAAIFIFLLPISGFFFFHKQCCRNHDRVKHKNNNSFEILSCGYLLLLIGMQAVMTGSFILSLESIDYILNNTNDINKFVRSISEDAINVIEIILDDIKCEMEITLSKLFDKVKYLSRQLPSNAFNHYKESDGYINMQSAINNLENVSWASNKTPVSLEIIICDIRILPKPLQIKMENLTLMINDIISYINQINEHYNKVYQMNNTWNNLDDLVVNSKEMQNILEESDALITDTEKRTMKMFGIIHNGAVDVIKFIQKNNQEMDNFHKNYIESREFAETGNILYLLVIIPVLSVIIPTIIVVFCGIAKLFANDKSLKIFNCGRYFGLFALAGAFFTGWIVMLIASLSFVVGYSVETFCNPLFHDPEMRFFKALPSFYMQNPIDNKIFTTNIGNIIMRCKNNETILSVLEVERLINTDAIMKKMDVEEKRDEMIDVIKNINFKQHFPEQFFNQLIEDSEQLKKMNIELHNFAISGDIIELNESFRVNFNYMKNNVSKLIEVIDYTVNTTKQIVEEHLYSGEIIDENVQIIIKESNHTIAEIREYIHGSIDHFQKNSYGCRPVYDIWENTGITVSQKINRPIQGHWVSTALLAFSFVPVIVLTVLIIEYLTTYNRKYDLKENLSENTITMSTTTDAYQ
ncbi:putative integral membrane protein [Acanthocheilonema viteae]